ncbi:MAG: flagellar hook-length control protein FliK [Gammaproteobacteria bacterium]|nr:flagellar hook-length control protein FliK [Gammaproteobacteria bacterium]
MFELALLGSGFAGPGKAEGGVRIGDGDLLSLVFGGDASDPSAFAGELQALLMQMPPDLAAHVQALLQGGTGLPQAASARPVAAVSDQNAEPLMTLASATERVPLPQIPLPAAPATPVVTSSVTGVVVPEIGAGVDPATTAAAVGTPPPVVAMAVAQQPLPPQLAGSLLDMAVPQQVGTGGWADAIGERVAWMVNGDQQFARLKLNPPQLGPLEIRISVSHDQSSVSFIAHHAATREALEAAMPRLREMFNDASLQLVRADVGDPAAGRDGFAGSSADRTDVPEFPARDFDEPDLLPVATGIVSAVGLVDLFV